MTDPTPWNAPPGELSQDREHDEPEPEQCPKCKGKGWDWWKDTDGVAFSFYGVCTKIDCPDCEGSGVLREGQ
jgi:DnaJ-class molecular chaperone